MKNYCVVIGVVLIHSLSNKTQKKIFTKLLIKLNLPHNIVPFLNLNDDRIKFAWLYSMNREAKLSSGFYFSLPMLIVK